MDREIRRADVVIVGGGASGLAAAIELGMKAPALDVLVIEKMPEPGRKIRATGSGRCNISNTAAAGFSRIMEFFREIGLVTKTYENGLVYPYSESAADVATLLTERAASLGVKIACGEELMTVKYLPASLAFEGAPEDRNIFMLETVIKDRDGLRSIRTHALYVILAMGGKAGPTFGTIGDGFRIARNLGHRIVTPVPALTGIECDEWEEGNKPCGITLGGTRSSGVVSLYRDPDEVFGEETKVFEEAGEIQFTKYGLSGICVFNMTRYMRFNRRAGESLDQFLVKVDLFPDGDITEYIRDRQKGCFADTPVGEMLRTVFKEPLADYVIGASDDGPDENGRAFEDRSISSLSDEEVRTIADHVHSLEFHPVQMRGWNDAQVTMGGVSLDEINEATSESLLVKGLYITGELADRDFRCGGYNLSNAWITGLAAADDIAQ
ncbi:MAG: aminoacetone oxidase family FAD-binding enzyme [Mogibacterium sp.]|nr:aminoacetone oxidase family FAD-binding enzyme [Mogibacterium sp.]